MGPLEQEVDELMRRGALGTAMALKGAVHGFTAGDPKALQESLEFLIELIGVQRQAILRVAREIDDLRASGAIVDQ